MQSVLRALGVLASTSGVTAERQTFMNLVRAVPDGSSSKRTQAAVQRPLARCSLHCQVVCAACLHWTGVTPYSAFHWQPAIL
jgi:hypothetical protein